MLLTASLQYRDKLFHAERTNQVFYFLIFLIFFLSILQAHTQRPKWCARRTRKDQSRKTLEASTTRSRRTFKIMIIYICRFCFHLLTNIINSRPHRAPILPLLSTQPCKIITMFSIFLFRRLRVYFSKLNFRPSSSFTIHDPPAPMSSAARR